MNRKCKTLTLDEKLKIIKKKKISLQSKVRKIKIKKKEFNGPTAVQSLQTINSGGNSDGNSDGILLLWLLPLIFSSGKGSSAKCTFA